MTEVVIETENPQTEEHTDSAEDIAEAIVEAQEEAREELEQEAAVENAVEASVSALEAVSSHEHSEYALIGHSHPELDYSERMSALEGRVQSIEAGLMSEESEEVEEIEPTHETATPEPEHKRTGFRRGRR